MQNTLIPYKRDKLRDLFTTKYCFINLKLTKNKKTIANIILW